MNQICCLLTFLSYGVIAQKMLIPDQLQQDFSVFENSLKKGHPDLYEYVEKTKLDALFNNAKEQLQKENNDISFYKLLNNITSQIRDANVTLSPSLSFETTQNYFPLILKIIQAEFYTDTNDFNIPVGSKILSINGIRSNKIFSQLKKHTAADGYNRSKKYRDLETKFGTYYAYEYGYTKEYEVSYITPNNESDTIIIPAQSFNEVKQRAYYRSSLFANFHAEKNGVNFYSNRISTKIPFIEYKEEMKTAILVVNSFELDITTFRNKISKIFKELNKKEIRHLIIDIRQNTSGRRENAIGLFSYIANSYFKQRKSTYISSLSIPEKTYTTNHLSEKLFLVDPYKNHISIDGWESKFDELEPLMVPFRDRFCGNVYVLTSGATFSAGAAFAYLAKNDPNIVVIGEETGSGYQTHTGDFPVHYELPNSKIRLTLSMVKINNFASVTAIPRGRGTLPDGKIFLTQQDLIDGKDPVLDYMFRLLKN